MCYSMSCVFLLKLQTNATKNEASEQENAPFKASTANMSPVHLVQLALMAPRWLISLNG